ncbi:hypothetical protein BDZ89DRAFT_952648 [Hymenopellis radicata]|nr:hypothetical protein BDZ89DRAFT_952648 [Hymenopellis radicata]
MYTLNTTIDDSSPLILYSPEGSWEQGNAEDDPELERYWGESYTHTFQEGAEAWFGFEGTGVTIFGARRDFRGEYTVRLDGQLVETSSAFVDGPGEYQSVLYNVTGLDQTRHSVVMRNSGNMSLDIDCIYWTAEVGEGSYKESPPQLLDDTQSAFTWTPKGAWTAPTNDLVKFMNATGHSTTHAGASVNYTFTSYNTSYIGDAVSIYGTIGPQNSRYTVQLDDKEPQNFSAVRQTYDVQVLLFQANNLDSGEHSVIVQNEDRDRMLQIDYALAFSDQARCEWRSLSVLNGSWTSVQV